MSQYVIDSLKTVAEKILESVRVSASSITSIAEGVRKLPDLFKALGDRVSQAISDSIQAQGEFQIQARLANVQAKKALVEAEDATTAEIRSHLAEDAHQIEERFGKIQRELNEDAKNRVRELDDHLLTIYQKYYPAGVGGAFGRYVDPILNLLFQDSVMNYSVRSRAMKHAIVELTAACRAFVGSRSKFFADLSHLTIDRTTDGNGHFQVPVWIIRGTKDEGGAEQSTVWLPGDREKQQNSTKTVAEELRGCLASEQGQALLGELVWREDETFKAKLLEAVNLYGRKTGRRRSTIRLVTRAIQDSELRTVGGGSTK